MKSPYALYSIFMCHGNTYIVIVTCPTVYEQVFMHLRLR